MGAALTLAWFIRMTALSPEWTRYARAPAITERDGHRQVHVAKPRPFNQAAEALSASSGRKLGKIV